MLAAQRLFLLDKPFDALKHGGPGWSYFDGEGPTTSTHGASTRNARHRLPTACLQRKSLSGNIVLFAIILMIIFSVVSPAPIRSLPHQSLTMEPAAGARRCYADLEANGREAPGLHGAPRPGACGKVSERESFRYDGCNRARGSGSSDPRCLPRPARRSRTPGGRG